MQKKITCAERIWKTTNRLPDESDHLIQAFGRFPNRLINFADNIIYNSAVNDHTHLFKAIPT